MLSSVMSTAVAASTGPRTSMLEVLTRLTICAATALGWRQPAVVGGTQQPSSDIAVRLADEPVAWA